MALSLVLVSCTEDEIVVGSEISPEIIQKVSMLGFNPDGMEEIEEGYRVERDIILTHENLDNVDLSHTVPDLEQYRTTNLVTTNGSRNITVYAPEGRRGYSAGMLAGIDEAIARFNAENLEITFTRITNSNSADIEFKRLSKRDERRGVLGSAGFPSGGDPYGTILMSGILESSYGLSTDGIATIVAHEMGHCIGFRHTDYFDRSISCGGATSNEGQAGVGAILIPGTPAGASAAAASWMLSCTDGSDRPFNNDDQTALDFLY